MRGLWLVEKASGRAEDSDPIMPLMSSFIDQKLNPISARTPHSHNFARSFFFVWAAACETAACDGTAAPGSGLFPAAAGRSSGVIMSLAPDS